MYRIQWSLPSYSGICYVYNEIALCASMIISVMAVRLLVTLLFNLIYNSFGSEK